MPRKLKVEGPDSADEVKAAYKSHRDPHDRERLPAVRLAQRGRFILAQIAEEDEHRYGLISILRRVWTLKGHRPTAPYQTKYQWGYVYGAANLGTEKAEFLYTPTVSLEGSRAFLEQRFSAKTKSCWAVTVGCHSHPDRRDGYRCALH